MAQIIFLLLLSLWSIPFALCHISIFHPSMWGFNVTFSDFPYDNRPVSPLINYTFDQWWFHGHLNFPPHPEDVFELQVGQNVTTELACTKAATTFFATGEPDDGGNIQNPDAPNDPCPGSPMSEYHTTGPDDVKGCALAIAYKSNVSDIQPEDFTVFSINQTCVLNRFTDFSVPARMPPCPNGMCLCAWFWIHSPDSGSMQNYMNGFQCNVTGSLPDASQLAASKIPRRCGADPTNVDEDQRTFVNTPGNCTYGAKQPFYWFQAEQNNMFEGTFSPPFYNDLYNFLDGAQNDIFVDSYASIPKPGPNQTELPIVAVISGDNEPSSVTSAGSSIVPDDGTSVPTSGAGISGRSGCSACKLNSSSTLSKRHKLLARAMPSRKLSRHTPEYLWRFW